MVHRVSDLPLEARGLVEILVGRPMQANESFSIRPLRILKEGASPEEAREAADRLERYFSEVDAKRVPSSTDHAAAALEEAMRHVRPGYSSVR